MARRIEENGPERQPDAAFVTSVTREVDTARVAVEMCDPQAFGARVFLGEAAGEEFVGGCKAVEFQGRFGTLIPHTADLAE